MSKKLTLSCVRPIINAAVIIIIFLIIYCPFNVGSKGLEFWKVTSGRITRGRNVPVIWIIKRIIAINVVLLNKKKIAMKTSHIPITTVQSAALKKGIQYTVSWTNCWAGDKSIIFKNPNQKNMINNGILTK